MFANDKKESDHGRPRLRERACASFPNAPAFCRRRRDRGRIVGAQSGRSISPGAVRCGPHRPLLAVPLYGERLASYAALDSAHQLSSLRRSIHMLGTRRTRSRQPLRPARATGRCDRRPNAFPIGAPPKDCDCKNIGGAIGSRGLRREAIIKRTHMTIRDSIQEQTLIPTRPATRNTSPGTSAHWGIASSVQIAISVASSTSMSSGETTAPHRLSPPALRKAERQQSRRPAPAGLALS